MTKFLIPVLAIAMLAMPVLAQTTTAPAPAKDFGTAAAAPAAGTPVAPAPAPVVAPAAPAKDFGTATAAPAAGTPATAGAPTTTPPVAPAAPITKTVPVLDKEGKPVIGEDGKPVTKTITVDKDGNPIPPKKQDSPFGDNFLFIMIGMIALMIFMSSRGKKKQQKKHQDMMEGLKKGDRVVSIGGIIGTLVEVKETEVVIKISDNARMRMTKGAIRAAGPEVDAAKAEDANSDTK